MTSQVLFKYIILNGNSYRKAAIIEGNIFSFFITMTELNMLPSQFYLQIEAETRITCMLPTQPTPSSFPTTSLSTTSLSLKQTSQNRPSTLAYTAHTSENKNASLDKNTREGNITLIIVILGSVFILILIVIIVLRCKKTKGRQENKHTGNASIEKETPEVCYESVEDGSQNGPQYVTSIKELRKTSLDQRSADQADKKEDPEVGYESIEDGSQKGLEYATSIMELRGTNRKSKSTSKVTDRSSNSDNLYGNNIIITRHELNRDTLQQGDKYENINMPDEEPTRNTLKATPGAGHTSTLLKDEVVSGDVLYAEVD